MTTDADSRTLVNVLLIGDRTRREFAEAIGWLRDHSATTCVPTVDAACEKLSASESDPELIVVAQSWPGEFSPREIDRLRRLAPLARVSELLGSFCEGETRTGRPAGGTLRHYWHQWLPRMAPQFERAGRGERPMWSLPVTATDDERLMVIGDVAAMEATARPPATGRGLIVVLVRDGMMARAICDACPTRGYSCVWLPQGREMYLSGVRAVVWDAPPAVESWADSLAELRREWHGAAVIALVGFPRIGDIDRLRTAGAAAVVSKPFLLDDLFWRLEEL